MKNIKQVGAAAMVVALLGDLTACGDMTTRQRDTAVGAGVGAAGGAVIGGMRLARPSCFSAVFQVCYGICNQQWFDTRRPVALTAVRVSCFSMD